MDELGLFGCVGRDDAFPRVWAFGRLGVWPLRSTPPLSAVRCSLTALLRTPSGTAGRGSPAPSRGTAPALHLCSVHLHVVQLYSAAAPLLLPSLHLSVTMRAVQRTTRLSRRLARAANPVRHSSTNPPALKPLTSVLIANRGEIAL